MDLTKYLHRQLKAEAYAGVDIANIYVDEVSPADPQSSVVKDLNVGKVT